MKKKNKFKPAYKPENNIPVKGETTIKKTVEVKLQKLPEEQVKIGSLKTLLRIFLTNIPVFLILAAVAFAVYWKVIRGEFLNIDDLAGIVQNPTIRSVKTALTTSSFHHVYYALIFHFFGLNSTAFHITSVVVHIINCVLVFLLAYLLFGKKIAFIATALFTVNPTGSEAINWLSAAGYLQQAALSMLNIILFILYRRSKNAWYLISAVILFGINIILYRTVWALTIPVMILIIDVLLLHPYLSYKKVFKFIPVYVPFLIISLIFTYSEVIKDFQSRAYTLETQHYLSIKSATPYLNRLPYSIFMMCRQYLYPERLTIYHEGRIIGNVEYTAMIITSVIYISLVIYFLKKNKTYAAFMILIPTATAPSFSPIAIAWLIAERYLYLGVAFFCMMIGKLLVDLEPKIHLKNFAKAFSVILFIVYFARTFVRADDFSSSKKLWLSTMKAAPLSYRVYNNLGDVYANEGQNELAIQNFQKSLELKPDYADAVHNMGFTYMQMGDITKAKYYLQKSFEMNPRLYQSLFKLGYIELQLGNFDGAKYYFQKTLEVNPGNAEAIQLLNNIAAAEASGQVVKKPSSSPATLPSSSSQ